MKIEQTGNELIIRETPGCLWLVSSLFLFVGGALVYGALGGFTDYEKQSPWMLALAFFMGSAAVATGIWIIYGAPITKVVINRLEENVRITRHGLFGIRNVVYNFAEIKKFLLVEERDDEGSLIWSLGVNLTNGETVKISSLPSHDENYKRDFVFAANEFAYKQIPPAQMVLEIEDESDAKIS